VLKLRAGGESINDIARQLQVSKQYVSLILIAAGQGGRRANANPATEGPMDNEQIQAAVAQMEEQGKYALAGLLRVTAERRKAALSAKKLRKQGS
jgi:transcriptional regulator